MKRISTQEDSLFPNLENDRRWETNGIFSEHYLRTRLRDAHYWPNDDYARAIYNYVSELWKNRYVGLAKGNEETTRREFLEKVIDKLGYFYFSNLGLSP